jgi:putative flippase GtrA
MIPARIVDLFSGKFKKFIKFGIVGLSNTAIALIVYYLLISLGAHYQLANVIAFIVSSLNGFLLNRSWVFNANDKSPFKQIIKYYIVYCSSLLISMALSWLWVEVFHFSKYISPLINLCVTIPYNYFFNNSWAFKKPEEKNDNKQ